LPLDNWIHQEYLQSRSSLLLVLRASKGAPSKSYAGACLSWPLLIKAARCRRRAAQEEVPALV